MIWDVEIAGERAQLFELKLVNHRVSLVGHGQFKLAVLPSTEVFNSPDNLALRYVKIGPIWVFCGLLRLHQGLGSVHVAVGVDNGRLDASHVLPRCDQGPTRTLLVLLVDEDAEYLRWRLEPDRHFFDSQVRW